MSLRAHAALYRDRADAGRRLAALLRTDPPPVRAPLVLGLARGGVPVAYEIATELGAPLDVFVVRKVGVPGREELACGAIASGGARVINLDVVREAGIDRETLAATVARAEEQLARRERALRGDAPPPVVKGRDVLVVDDGLATGATMRAAVLALREGKPATLTIAVPVAAPDVCAAFEAEVDEVVCAHAPRRMRAVGAWYEDFGQVSDDRVRELIERARREREAE